MPCCRLLTFFKINFFKKSFQNTIRVSDSLDLDQDRHSVSPDLGYMQMAKVVASKERVKSLLPFQDNLTLNALITTAADDKI